MKPILAYPILVLLSAGMLNIAPSASAAEERVTHYKAKSVKSVADAKAQLTAELAVVRDTLKQKKLSDSDFETIHKASYAFENVVDFLRAHPKTMTASELDALDEAVQAIHASSETHREAEVRRWYQALDTAAAALR